MRLTLPTLGAVLVCLLAPTDASAQSRTFVVTAARWGTRQADAVRRAGGAIVYSHPDAGIAIVESRSAGFLADLRKIGDVTSVSEDRVVRWQKPARALASIEAVASAGDDETFWNLQWGPRAISAPEAWNAGCRGQGVRVAIVDGGIYDGHVDLASQIDAAHSISFVPDQPWNTDVGTFWHGTHIAGIVAAADNAIGTIGVAPDATIVAVKVLHDGIGSFGQLIAGIVYAATPIENGGGGADIINLSVGALLPKNEAQGLTNAMATAINYAAERGVLVITSVGNEGVDLDHAGNWFHTPSQSGTASGIAATAPVGFAVGFPNGATNFSNRAAYSNYGVSAVFASAPGGDSAYGGDDWCALPVSPAGVVYQPCWLFDTILSTVRGDGASTATYGWATGTSTAAPAVAGVAALIKANHPGISLGALKGALAHATDDVGKPGRDPFSGHGFINAYKACTQ